MMISYDHGRPAGDTKHLSCVIWLWWK